MKHLAIGLLFTLTAQLTVLAEEDPFLSLSFEQACSRAEKENKIVFIRHLHRKYTTGGRPYLIVKSIASDFRQTPDCDFWAEFIEMNPQYSTFLPTLKQRLDNGSVVVTVIVEDTINKDDKIQEYIKKGSKTVSQPLENGKSRYKHMERQ